MNTSPQYDALLLQRLDQIHTDAREAERSNAAFHENSIERQSALEIKVDTLTEKLDEDSRSNRRLAIKSASISGAISGFLAAIGISFGVR